MIENSPLVTVLIATYNKSQALRCAVESVLWQTMPDFELWIIGDGCTDDSADVVASFGDPRVNWHNLDENSGYQSAPHNEGLRRARGRYIAYLNHDDLWLPNHLQILVEGAEQNDCDFVYSILEWVFSDERQNYADIPIYPDAPRPPESSATMHRREVVTDIGYWKEPKETFAVPRAEYFRRAQFRGKSFQLIPRLTVLKFAGIGGDYSQPGGQHLMMRQIRGDTDFAEKHLAVLLACAYSRLEQPTPPKLYLHQFGEFTRRKLVRRHIDPARLVFWQRPGSQVRAWRYAHKLDLR